MILYVDSGSTKTDWKVVSTAGVVDECSSNGINPMLQSKEEIIADQKAVLSNLQWHDIRSIVYFGAGCGTERSKCQVRDFLASIFLSASAIRVESDLIGAGEVLFGKATGIACILGTGSNSGFFVNGKLKSHVPSLGYVLGDEGGGSQIGRHLIVDLLRKKMPPDIAVFLQEQIQMTEYEILRQIYHQPYGNRFMARFVGIVNRQYGEHAYFQKIIRYELNLFFENCLNKYDVKPNTPIGFVGSIAHYFAPVLHDLAETHGYHLEDILKKPIDRLIKSKLNTV